MQKEDKQYILERAFEGIWRQGRVSIGKLNGKDICKYRGTKKCKCAIGHLISDDFYKPALEDLAACEPMVVTAICQSLGITIEVVPLFSLIPLSSDQSFLRILQRALHDDFELRLDEITINKSRLIANAKALAKDFDLKDDFLRTYQV